jgi:hypothetical protein
VGRFGSGRLDGANQRQIVGFGATGGEHDLTRSRADQRRHLGARDLDRLAGAPSWRM